MAMLDGQPKDLLKGNTTRRKMGLRDAMMDGARAGIEMEMGIGNGAVAMGMPMIRNQFAVRWRAFFKGIVVGDGLDFPGAALPGKLYDAIMLNHFEGEASITS